MMKNLTLSFYAILSIILITPSVSFAQCGAYYVNPNHVTGCPGLTHTISVTTVSAVSDHRWYTSQTGGTPVGRSITRLPNFDLISSITKVFTENETYWVAAVCAEGESPYRTEVSFYTGALSSGPVVNPITAGCNTVAILTASGASSRGTYAWYDASKNVKLGEGATLPVCVLNNTTFYCSKLDPCESTKVPVLVTVNKFPVANAGLDLSYALPASTIAVQGSGSDPENSTITYSWKKITGPDVSRTTGTTSSKITLMGPLL